MQIDTFKTEILIIGAGPAGSTAACILANNGFQVILVDKYQFPRDKVCGDGIINDTLDALSYLNLKEKVLQQALNLKKLRIYAPNGSSITVDGEFATLPRRDFDDIIRQKAIKNGAKFLQLSLDSTIEENGMITGVSFKDQTANSLKKIYAKITLLATGASKSPLKIFKVVEKNSTTAFAIRGYFRNYKLKDKIDYMNLCYFKKVLPGYGWVFPLKNNLFNIGVGYYNNSKKNTPRNIYRLWEIFLNSFPLAKDIVGDNNGCSNLKGAFLRTGMQGTKFHSPGLLVIGEAAALTYPFSGEGIGKAMQSALIASDEIINTINNNKSDLTSIGKLYENRLVKKFQKRYQIYSKSQKWLTYPSIANYICWRANRSKYLMKNIEDLINEKTDPSSIFSVKSMIKSLFY